MRFHARRFLDPNTQPGTGAPAAGSPPPDPSPGPRPTPVKLPANVEPEFHAVVLRYGNAEAAARALFDENYRLRRQRRTDKRTIEAFETRNPQGSIVLHGEALAEFNAYKALGKPTELKTQIDEGKKTRADLDAAKRKETRTKAATLLKFNPAVLEDRLTIDNRELEIRTENGTDGKPHEVVYARKAGDAGATWEALETVAARDWKDHIPALRAAPAGGNGGAGANGAGNGNGLAAFVTFPDNGGGNGASGGGASLVDNFTKQRAEAARKVVNPLAPQGARSGT